MPCWRETTGAGVLGKRRAFGVCRANSPTASQTQQSKECGCTKHAHQQWCLPASVIYKIHTRPAGDEPPTWHSTTTNFFSIQKKGKSRTTTHLAVWILTDVATLGTTHFTARFAITHFIAFAGGGTGLADVGLLCVTAKRGAGREKGRRGRGTDFWENERETRGRGREGGPRVSEWNLRYDLCLPRYLASPACASPCCLQHGAKQYW